MLLLPTVPGAVFVRDRNSLALQLQFRLSSYGLESQGNRCIMFWKKKIQQSVKFVKGWRVVVLISCLCLSEASFHRWPCSGHQALLNRTQAKRASSQQGCPLPRLLHSLPGVATLGGLKSTHPQASFYTATWGQFSGSGPVRRLRRFSPLALIHSAESLP